MILLGPGHREVQKAWIDPVRGEGRVASPEILVVAAPVRRIEIQELQQFCGIGPAVQHRRLSCQVKRRVGKFRLLGGAWRTLFSGRYLPGNLQNLQTESG